MADAPDVKLADAALAPPGPAADAPMPEPDVPAEAVVPVPPNAPVPVPEPEPPDPYDLAEAVAADAQAHGADGPPLAPAPPPALIAPPATPPTVIKDIKDYHPDTDWPMYVVIKLGVESDLMGPTPTLLAVTVTWATVPLALAAPNASPLSAVVAQAAARMGLTPGAIRLWADCPRRPGGPPSLALQPMELSQSSLAARRRLGHGPSGELRLFVEQIAHPEPESTSPEPAPPAARSIFVARFDPQATPPLAFLGHTTVTVESPLAALGPSPMIRAPAGGRRGINAAVDLASGDSVAGRTACADLYDGDLIITGATREAIAAVASAEAAERECGREEWGNHPLATEPGLLSLVLRGLNETDDFADDDVSTPLEWGGDDLKHLLRAGGVCKTWAAAARDELAAATMPETQALEADLRGIQDGSIACAQLTPARVGRLCDAHVDIGRVAAAAGASPTLLALDLAPPDPRPDDVMPHLFTGIGLRCIADALRGYLASNLTELRLDPEQVLLGGGGTRSLADYVATSNTLKKLTVGLGTDCIGECGLVALADALRVNTVLTELTSVESSMSETGARALIDAIKSNRGTKLAGLRLQGCGLSAQSGVRLGDMLSSNRSILRCDLRCNHLGNDGAVGLANGLAETRARVQILRLGYNGIGVPGIRALSENIAYNGVIQLLELGSVLPYYNEGAGPNVVGDAGAGALAMAVAQHSSLSSLILVNTGIGSEGAEYLAAVLSINRSLLDLDLSFNPIGDAGAKAIAEPIQSSSTNEGLYIFLKDCGIGEPGVVALGEALQSNTGVEALNLAQNVVGLAGAKALSGALRSEKSTLCILDLSNAQLDARLIAPIAEALASAACNLQELSLGANRGLGEDGFKSIGKSLATNRALQSLNLSSCDAGRSEDGCQFLAEGLSQNSTLKVLNVAANNYNEPAMLRMLGCLRANKSLNSVAAQHNWSSRLSEGAVSDIAAIIREIGGTLKELDMTPTYGLFFVKTTQDAWRAAWVECGSRAAGDLKLQN